jgi:hypothetical protein
MEDPNYVYFSDNYYNLTCNEIIRLSKNAYKDISTTEDGRIVSAIKEKDVLEILQRRIVSEHPTWKFDVPKARDTADFSINGIWVNLKLTACKTSDNAFSKRGFVRSLTGNGNYPKQSNWTTFLNFIKTNGVLKHRSRMSEYHFLVINKKNDDVLLKSVFDIYRYKTNPSNILQIDWHREFDFKSHFTPDIDYRKKAISVLQTIQDSIRQQMSIMQPYADADFEDIVS